MKTPSFPEHPSGRVTSRLIPALFVSLCGSASLNAQTVILWEGAVNDVAAGAWGNAANWSGANVPDADTEQADLRKDWGGATAGTPNLTLGSDVTVNGLLFDDTGVSGDRAMTVNTGNTLTLAGSSPLIQIDGSTLILSSPLGGTVAWSKTGGGTLALNAGNSATFTGPIAVNEGTLDVRNVNALGDTAAATGVAAGARVIFGNLATGATVAEPFTIAGSGTANNGALNVGGSKTVNLSGPVTLSADAQLKADGGAAMNLTNAAGITAADKNLTFTVDGSVASTVTGPLALGSGGFTKASGSTVNLNGTNSYTGPTLVSGGTLAITGAAGSILGTSSITVNAGTLTLNNGAANVNRIADTLGVNLNLGGGLNLTANAAADTTETIGAVTLAAGAGTLTVGSAAGRVTTLAASTLTRGTGRSTALVRGTNLNQSAATNVARVTLADGGASLTLVGSNTLDNADVADSTQAVKIVPWMVGDSSTTGTGSGFVTYDTTLGLRVLTFAQTADLVPDYVTAPQPANAIVTFDAVLDNIAGITVNSLLFSTAAATLDSAAAKPLTINSGAIATSGNFPFTLGSGFSGIVLGNGEGVITVPGNTLTIASPVSVTAGGGLTKAGANTLALTAANTYTGPTVLNQGTLAAANLADGGIASALGASSSAPGNLIFNGGTLLYSGPTASSDRGATLLANGTVNVATLGNTLTLSGEFAGSGALIKAGTGTLALTGPSTFTGNAQINGTPTANTLRIEHPEALGSPAAVKNVVITGSNRQVSILELANNITVDANKAINTAGKSFLANNESASGSPVFLRNAAGDNTWLGNVWITATGGAYSIESAAGTLTLGSPGTASTLRQSAGTDTRAIDFRGAGDIVVHSRIINNGASLTGIQKFGSGTLVLPRTDNTCSFNPNLAVGTTIVESLANGGTPSSIGTGTSFNFGGTLRHLGAADSTSNRAFGLVGAAPVLDSSGTGSLSLTSGTTAAFTLGAGTTVAPFLTGATVLTANDVWTLIPGLTIAGTGISPGTRITAINYDARQITLDTPTTADSANSSLVTISGTGDLDRTLTLTGTNAGDNRLAAPLVNPAGTGVLGLLKSGAGKWILSGNNSYAGPTSVSAGTLLVNGSHSGAGPCSVAAGATLGGSGSLAAAVNVAGTLAPGAGLGTLATGSLTFAANSTLAVEINSATLGTDALVVTGDVVTGGSAVNLTVTDLGGNVPVANGTKLVLVDYSGVWADTDVVRFNGVPVPNGSNIVLGANTFTVNYSDDSLDGSAMTLTSANAATPFQTWINGFSGELPNAADRLPGADPDQDGRDNLLEYALNGDPADVADAGKMVFSTADSGDAGSAPDLSVTLAVRNGAVAGAGPGGSVTLAVDGIVYTLQGSETLAVFDKAVNEVTPASPLTPAPSAGWTTRTFQVSDSNTLPGKRFIRLSVSQ